MCEVRHMLELPGVCLLRCNARFAAWLQKSSCSKIMWRNMWDIWIHWSKTRLVAVLSTYQWYPIRESATELDQYGQLVVINVAKFTPVNWANGISDARLPKNLFRKDFEHRWVHLCGPWDPRGNPPRMWAAWRLGKIQWIYCHMVK